MAEQIYRRLWELQWQVAILEMLLRSPRWFLETVFAWETRNG